jgi:hypothetical protein
MAGLWRSSWALLIERVAQISVDWPIDRPSHFDKAMPFRDRLLQLKRPRQVGPVSALIA